LSQSNERFESAVLVHLDAAYNLARWLSRSEHDAQDIVQEAFIRALRGFDQFRGGDARTWLLAIVRNVSFTWLQRRKTNRELHEQVEEPVDDRIDPEAILLRAADVQRVRDSIERLPADLRAVLVLRDMEGLSYKEIAGTLEVPIGTVMSRLSRARERLAAMLVEPAPVRELP